MRRETQRRGVGRKAYVTTDTLNLAAAGSQYFAADPAVVAQQMIGAVPMRRYGRMEEIPGAVAFLLGDDASYITGVNVPIAGGIL